MAEQPSRTGFQLHRCFIIQLEKEFPTLTGFPLQSPFISNLTFFSALTTVCFNLCGCKMPCTVCTQYNVEYPTHSILSNLLIQTEVHLSSKTCIPWLQDHIKDLVHVHTGYPIQLSKTPGWTQHPVAFNCKKNKHALFAIWYA